jgi:DNA (cytosine-5)-methyltransferase 1
LVVSQVKRPRVAEFFAGMGLVRHALDVADLQTVFANDVDPMKEKIYVENFGDGEFVREDIRELHGEDIPDIELAAASFPCTDLSLAGNRAGLAGEHSGLFWEFSRIIDEMGERKPQVILIENVPGFATSNGGEDLRTALHELSRLGYWCDIAVVDAAWFLPQSRQRLFIIGSLEFSGRESVPEQQGLWNPSVRRALDGAKDLKLHDLGVSFTPRDVPRLAESVERLPLTDERWWSSERRKRFMSSLSPLQKERLDALRAAPEVTWRTAYRRTRHGKPVWEVRADEIAGALRTARGGSSKQALVQVGNGAVQVRWMTPREYANLQGADDFKLQTVTTSQALFALGDAVCAPAVSWVASEYLLPLLKLPETERQASA